MALVSDIEIRLRADIARLQQDLTRARQEVSGAMNKITDMVKKAGAAFVGLAAGLSVAAFAGWIKGAIDATDAASDLAQRTGIAVEELAGLQLWFQIGGAEAGAFEASMVKLAKTIAAGGEEFKKIGVATRNADGSLRSNVQVLLDSGDAFAKLRDDTAKTALAVELFGKSGAVLIPILNSGSQGLREMTELADKLGLTFDQKTVDAAGQFNDTLDFLGLASQGVARQLAAQLLPALNSVVGSFLEFTTKGDGVKRAAAGISAVLKTLYTVGISVHTVFKTVGNTLGAAAAQVVAILTGDFQAVTKIGQAWKEDVVADFTDAAKTIVDVWNNAGGETVAALSGMQKGIAPVTDAAAKDAAKLAEAYADLISKLQERAAATGREVAGLAPLTEAEKAHIDLTEQIAKKKLVLTRAQEARARSLINEAGANDVLIASEKEWAALQQQLADNARDLAQERYALIDSARQEAMQNELAIETFGMTEAAIIRLTASRLLDQEAQRLGRDLTEDEIADLKRVIELKERSAKAVANRAELEAAKTFWTDIEKTAHDTFVSIADGGKNAFQRLKDTAKNTFFDWLYQQTLKKWIINIQANSGSLMSSVGGLFGGSGSGTGQGAGSLLSSIGTIFSGSGAGTSKGLLGSFDWYGAGSQIYQGFSGAVGAGGFTGAAAAGGAALAGVAGGIYGGRAISNGYGSNGAVNTGVAAGAAIGTAILPVIGTALGALVGGLLGGVYNRAFGYKNKEYSDTSTVNGSFGASGFNGTLDTAWLQKGGWFRSDKKGVDSNAISTELASGLVAAYDEVKAASSGYALALGITATSIETRSQAISVALGKDNAANEKALIEFFGGVSDAIAAELVPGLAKFTVEGETASATLQRLAANAQVVESLMSLVGATSQKAFGAVGVAAIEARERLIAAAGGLDALAAQTTFFNANFLTQAEQIAPVQAQVVAQLAALGYAGVTTSDQFKAAVQGLASSGALATAEGAKTFAGLLALAPAFKAVTDYTKELADEAAQAAKDIADAAQAERDRADAAAQAAKDAALAALTANEELLRGQVDAALAAVGRAVNAQKDLVTKAYQDSMAVLEARISSVGDSISRITELSTLLKNSLGTVSSDAQQGASRAAARASITTALALAKASGVLPSADSLRDALSTLNQDASDQFSSLADYQREVARTNAEITALGGLTDRQLTEAQMQLALLEDQKALAERAYEAEIARLDSIIEWAQAEVDAINGVNTSVLSVLGAIATLNVALQGLKQGATPTNPTGGSLSLDQLYQTVLGREADAAGYEFWKKAYGDVIDSAEYADFIKAAQPELEAQERLRRQAEAASAAMSGTMAPSPASADQQQSNERMEAQLSRIAAASEQFASQFNNVSGGGNMLVVEAG